MHGVGDADAVDLGQAQIDAGDVGRELADLLERLAPVADLGDQLELGPGAHGAHDALPEERVVVGDDHAEPGHGPIVAMALQDGRRSSDRRRRGGPRSGRAGRMRPGVKIGGEHATRASDCSA